MPTPLLENRVALITGASRGIGEAAALLLAEHGARVGCLSRNVDDVERVAEAVRSAGGVATAAACDVTDSDSIATALDTVRQQLGTIQVLVNNAGIAESAPFHRTSPEIWKRTLDVNLFGCVEAIQGVLPGMKETGWGRVINVASVAGRIGFAYTSAYVASKHALVGLTRSLALEVATAGITVNAVCPGWVDTEMVDRAVANISEKTGRSLEESRASLERMSPQNRLMTPREVAHSILFLAADDAGGINGQTIIIDGGATQA